MALRDYTRISREMRQRILRTARRLNYQPNFVAISLGMEKPNTFGIIITSILNPFYPKLAKGARRTHYCFKTNFFECGKDLVSQN